MKTVCLLLLLASAAYATSFVNCPEGFPPHSLDITGCDGSLPVCALQAGTTVDVVVAIVTDHEVTKLPPTLTLTALGGQTTNVPLGDDLCPQVASGCPIEAGADAVINLPVTVSGSNLGLYTAKLSIADQDGANVACAEVEVLIL